jgi:hypothetical protein
MVHVVERVFVVLAKLLFVVVVGNPKGEVQERNGTRLCK